MPSIHPELTPLTDRKLFDLPSDRLATFLLGSNRGEWYRFAMGYKHAADRLSSEMATYGRVPESAGFPVLYLYRHYVELMLKGVLLDTGELLEEPERIPRHHELRRLWGQLRARLTTIEQLESDEWLERAGTLIGELDSIDERAVAFRYPVNRDGDAVLPVYQAIDLAHFSAVMDELSLVLEGIAAALDQQLEYKREIEYNTSHDYDYL